MYESYPLSHATESVSLAGGEVTDSLMHQLNRRGYSFHTASDREVVQSVKEECQRENAIRINCGKNEKTDNNESYELPDGHKLIMGRAI